MPTPLGFGILRGSAGLGVMRGGGARTYTDKILNTQRVNLVGYWTLNGNALDASGNGFNGAATAITYGDGVVTGQQAAVFDGATSYINLISAGLAAAFSGATGSVFAWFKVTGVGDWADAANRKVFRFRYDDTNVIQFHKRSTAGQVARAYTAGGTPTSNNVVMDPVNPTGWCWCAVTWNKAQDRATHYLIGAGAGTPLVKTGLGDWAAPISSAFIGAASIGPVTEPWKGSIAHVALWDAELSGAQIAALAVTAPPF